ncbi:MAG: hypothetical protein HKN33_06670 [Pyrinomonadaceae bacterium]|nr:hypothetical protein [Pyrinomonadaceae bacterium]
MDLSNKSLLHNEDIIVTADSGSLVLALNPNSYLYLGPNAFVAVKNTELNKMHFDIERGQMVLFVRSLKNGASLVIHTPPGILAIRKGGRYIVSVETNGNTKANVIRGELGYLNRGRLVKLKKGRQVEFVKRKAVSENQ